MYEARENAPIELERNAMVMHRERSRYHRQPTAERLQELNMENYPAPLRAFFSKILVQKRRKLRINGRMYDIEEHEFGRGVARGSDLFQDNGRNDDFGQLDQFQEFSPVRFCIC